MHAILTRLNDSSFRRFLKRLAMIGLLSTLGALLVSPAAAAGRVIWKQTTIKEHTGKEAWYLDLEVHLQRAPDVGQKGMRFEFTQTSEFERSLVDGHDEPQERTIPLTNQQALIESQLVGFMDPGTGTIQKRTRFSFKVTRAHGYRAGQYQVKIKDSDSGQLIGTPTTLTFKGENPVVDRRSIVFTGEKKEKKSSDESSSGPKNMVDLNAPDEPAPAPASSSNDSSDDASDEPMDEGDVPPSVEERPGGGCHIGRHQGPSSFSWSGIFALFGLVLLARRRLS